MDTSTPTTMTAHILRAQARYALVQTRLDARLGAGALLSDASNAAPGTDGTRLSANAGLTWTITRSGASTLDLSSRVLQFTDRIDAGEVGDRDLTELSAMLVFTQRL